MAENKPKSDVKQIGPNVVILVHLPSLTVLTVLGILAISEQPAS